jgi:hypothetical protein
MRRWSLPVVALVLALPVAGCGDAYSKNEAVGKDMMQVLNDLADALESVKDQESAKAAAKKINEICDRMEALGKKAEALPKVTQAEKEKLDKQFNPQAEKLMPRLIAAGASARAKGGDEPDFQNALKRLESVGENLKKLGGGK